jgi:hypothetical protein
MKYIIGILVTLGLIILAFILIFRGSGAPAAKVPDVTHYANTNVVMQLTIDGPINAELDHRITRITVGQNQVNITTFQGYQNTVITNKSFVNNTTAYTDFLHALQLSGFTKGSNVTSLQDERGQCPTGNRFIYEVINGSQDTERYWRSSCGTGNFRGTWAIVNALFTKQVPNYSDITVSSTI